MALPQVISRNQAQVVSKFAIGSRLTVWGSGGVTEAIVGTEAMSTYRVPTGKRAIIKGTLVVESGTDHTYGSLRKFSGSSSLTTEVCLVGIGGEANLRGQESFEVEFDDNGDFFTFSASGTPNDMDGGCLATVEELPA